MYLRFIANYLNPYRTLNLKPSCTRHTYHVMTNELILHIVPPFHQSKFRILSQTLPSFKSVYIPLMKEAYSRSEEEIQRLLRQRKKPRARTSCYPCRARKVRCDRLKPLCVRIVRQELIRSFVNMQMNLGPRSPRPQYPYKEKALHIQKINTHKRRDINYSRKSTHREIWNLAPF